ncbi:MAG: MBL fold metallo-hydrolase, partial [Actinomycetota bacterium]|nr:MBL fold metallo-hydrolase [Actinomycetota bacterium]
MATSPELIAPGVYRVDAFGLSNAINVLLLENDDGWTLVDTGVGSSVGRIRDAITALGSRPEDLKRIFLTHQHNDHTGGLSGLLRWAPHAQVGAPPHEAEIISGRRGKDPFSHPVLRFLARNAELPTAPVTKVLREGDFVSGFRVIS